MHNRTITALTALFIMSFGVFLYGKEQFGAMQVTIGSTGHKQIPLLVVLDAAATPELAEIAAVVKKDLEFSGQFVVTVHTVTSHSKKVIKDLFHTHKTLLALFLTASDATNIEWRLYDTFNAQMVKGKKYCKQGKILRGWAHAISDMVWPDLTGQEGCFSTRIAYCKEAEGAQGTQRYKHIYIADYDGSNPECIITSPTINLAPRWNNDGNNPLLFYSECTRSNIRLMVSNLGKKQWVASNFDGINMLPAFSPDGTKVVYCASRGNGSCDLYFYQKDAFKRLTTEGNNISPTWFGNQNSFFFSSDTKTGKPQIYCYHLEDGSIEPITHGGCCLSPAYCDKNKLLAYTKIVDGCAQIFLYDTVRKKHTQITHDPYNKEECCWSVCGNYLLYGAQERAVRRIALYNLLTKEQRFLTAKAEKCSYPTWSGRYFTFPALC
jgi:TolB protein